jgi:hypothetical protein
MSCPYGNQCHQSDYGTDCKYDGNETSCPQYKNEQYPIINMIEAPLSDYPESDLVELLKPAK